MQFDCQKGEGRINFCKVFLTSAGHVKSVTAALIGLGFAAVHAAVLRP